MKNKAQQWQQVKKKIKEQLLRVCEVCGVNSLWNMQDFNVERETEKGWQSMRVQHSDNDMGKMLYVIGGNSGQQICTANSIN